MQFRSHYLPLTTHWISLRECPAQLELKPASPEHSVSWAGTWEKGKTIPKLTESQRKVFYFVRMYQCYQVGRELQEAASCHTSSDGGSPVSCRLAGILDRLSFSLLRGFPTWDSLSAHVLWVWTGTLSPGLSSSVENTVMPWRQRPC